MLAHWAGAWLRGWATRVSGPDAEAPPRSPSRPDLARRATPPSGRSRSRIPRPDPAFLRSGRRQPRAEHRPGRRSAVGRTWLDGSARAASDPGAAVGVDGAILDRGFRRATAILGRGFRCQCLGGSALLGRTLRSTDPALGGVFPGATPPSAGFPGRAGSSRGPVTDPARRATPSRPDPARRGISAQPTTGPSLPGRSKGGRPLHRYTVSHATRSRSSGLGHIRYPPALGAPTPAVVERRWRSRLRAGETAGSALRSTITPATRRRAGVGGRGAAQEGRRQGGEVRRLRSPHNRSATDMLLDLAAQLGDQVRRRPRDCGAKDVARGFPALLLTSLSTVAARSASYCSAFGPGLPKFTRPSAPWAGKDRS